MRQSIIYLLLVFGTVLYLWPGDVLAREPGFHLGGYLKNFSIVYSLPNTRAHFFSASPSTLGSVSNRLRLDAAYDVIPWMNIDLSYNLVPRIQDPLLFAQDLFAFSINPFGYRFDDLDEYLYPDERDDISSFAVFQNLDRALLSFRLPDADVYVGRQAIAWGSAHVVNPTDVIAPFAYTELDTENRIGVDAVRIRIPLGFMGEIDAGYVAGSDFDLRESAVFLRGKYYVARADVSAMAINFQQNLLIGFDIARAIGGAGFWFEGAWVGVDAFTNNGNGSGDNYVRVSTGADYSFSSKTYAFVEYHFNQAGSNDAAEYIGALSTTAYREGTVYLLGEHYLIPSISYQFTPLITGTAELITNLGDPSVSLTPYLDYNVAQNVYLAVGAYLGIGKGPRVNLTGGLIPRAELQSEFGAYPDFYYLSFRVYF
jgi:hypothetical protein